jgi:hypothetical protein
MVRPLKPDRDVIARTIVRVSPKIKRLLQELKERHGFATTDQVLRYYLYSNIAIAEAGAEAENKPVFYTHTAKDICDLTKKNPYLNKQFKEAAAGIQQVINRCQTNQSKSRVGPKRLWRKRQRHRRNW